MSSSEPDRDPFECAFIATSYFLDRRGIDLLAPLAAPGRDAERLAQALGRPEREVRAQVLAREIGRIAQSLEARRLR